MGRGFQEWRSTLKISPREEKTLSPADLWPLGGKLFFPWANFWRWINFDTWNSAHLEILYFCEILCHFRKFFTTLFFLLLYFFLAKKPSSGSNAWMMIKRIFLLYLCPNPEVETLAMKKDKIYKIFFIYIPMYFYAIMSILLFTLY